MRGGSKVPRAAKQEQKLFNARVGRLALLVHMCLRLIKLNTSSKPHCVYNEIQTNWQTVCHFVLTGRSVVQTNPIINFITSQVHLESPTLGLLPGVASPGVL